MKKILTLLFLLSTLTFGQALDKLEQVYLSKAELLQSGSDKDIRERKEKLAKDSKRLAGSYLRALKGMLKAETQKGDFDAAIAIKAKIVEIEAILSGDAKPVVPAVKPLPLLVPTFSIKKIILAKVKSTSPKNAGPIISDKFGNFSPELKGARIYNYNKVDKNMVENGAGEFEILESGIVYLALHYHFDGGDGGGWTDSRWTLKQFNDAGWTNVNWNLFLLNRDKRYNIVKKYCKKGEIYKLRCNKYIPPQLLFPIITDPVVGKWNWNNGQSVMTLYKDGTGKSTVGHQVQWKLLSLNNYYFSNYIWDGKKYNDFTGILKLDEMKIRAIGRAGGWTATRIISKIGPIVGTWKWSSGTIVRISADGTVRLNNKISTIKLSSIGVNKYRMNYIKDLPATLILSQDGNSLDISHHGKKLTAKRIN